MLRIGTIKFIEGKPRVSRLYIVCFKSCMVKNYKKPKKYMKCSSLSATILIISVFLRELSTKALAKKRGK